MFPSRNTKILLVNLHGMVMKVDDCGRVVKTKDGLIALKKL